MRPLDQSERSNSFLPGAGWMRIIVPPLDQSKRSHSSLGWLPFSKMGEPPRAGSEEGGQVRRNHLPAEAQTGDKRKFQKDHQEEPSSNWEEQKLRKTPCAGQTFSGRHAQVLASVSKV